MGLTVLEQEVVLGTFTHRQTYLPPLLESLKTHLPDLPFVLAHREGKIQENWKMLLDIFRCTNKRYWCFFDDDIKFLDSRIIHDCVALLIRHKLGAVGVYSTYDQAFTADRAEGLPGFVEKKAWWLPGYFMLVDSQKVGDVDPDLKIPHDHFGDADYCASIRAKGYEIGICPHIVTHWPAKKDPQPTEQEAHQYLWSKWGAFYYDYIGYQYNVLDWGLVPKQGGQQNGQ